MNPLSIPCVYCRHLDVKSIRGGPERAHPRCPAFPDGIPQAIWQGWNRHTSPFPGDRGIQFEERDKPAE